MKIFLRKSAVLAAIVLVFSGVISCEKDFTDIGSSVINNSEFELKDTILEVEISSLPITNVRADGIALQNSILGQYLFGVFNKPNFEKIEASLVSQLNLPTGLDVANETDSTTIHTELDTVILKIPYQATLVAGTTSEYTLDSIFGDKDESFTVNIFEINTFLNRLNPEDPTKLNSYNSDAVYEKIGSALNETLDYQFKPNATDTLFVVNRTLKSGEKFRDTITFAEDNNRPFARIPLSKAKFLEFMSKYEDSEFTSQDAFNNYFRGLLVEATGDNGAILSLSYLNNLSPSIELYYTNTVTLNATQEVIDTILKNDSFRFGGISNNIYKMTAANSLSSNQVAIQGTAGSMANVSIFNDGLTDLRSKNWLINDATLTFYVDTDLTQFDTISTPFRLFLYKNELDNNDVPKNPSVIKDVLTEGLVAFDGTRNLDSDKKPDNYTFKITDYISDLLSGDSDYNPPLGLKVFNPTDLPSSTTDSIVANYNWNPKSVILLNEASINGTRRAQLKISYSEKKD